MSSLLVVSVNLWPLLIPFGFFGAAFTFGAVMLTIFLKRTKISQTETQAGTAVHMETPLGTFDMRPENRQDPRLSRIPIYPGAMPENPVGAQEVSDIHICGRYLREISASYWTPDSTEQVWDFYRQKLPNWARNLDQARGKELIHPQSDCVLLLRISKGKDRTVIDTCIKPPGYPNLFERQK